jgi:hypothetical protein
MRREKIKTDLPVFTLVVFTCIHSYDLWLAIKDKQLHFIILLEHLQQYLNLIPKIEI